MSVVVVATVGDFSLETKKFVREELVGEGESVAGWRAAVVVDVYAHHPLLLCLCRSRLASRIGHLKRN
jgi:hypothetical protein